MVANPQSCPFGQARTKIQISVVLNSLAGLWGLYDGTSAAAIGSRILPIKLLDIELLCAQESITTVRSRRRPTQIFFVRRVAAPLAQPSPEPLCPAACFLWHSHQSSPCAVPCATPVKFGAQFVAT